MTTSRTLTTIRTPRRTALGIGAGLGLGAVMAACSSGTGAQSLASPTSGGLVLGLTYTPNIQFAPFYLALSRGEYAPAVSLRHHGEQEGQFDALLAETEQLVVAGGDEAIVAASHGNDLVIVGGYYQRYPGCLIIPEDSDITDLASLAGRTIGTPGRTGETWYSLKLALANAGLTEEEVSIQEIGYTQQSALVSGKVDAVVGFSNNDAVQIARTGTPVRTLDIGQDVPLLGASLVTTSAVLASAREGAADAVVASARGMSVFVEDPDAAVEATKEYVPDLVDPVQAEGARAVALATAELIRPSEGTVIGALSREHVGATIEFLDGHGLLGPERPDAEEVCDPLLGA